MLIPKIQDTVMLKGSLIEGKVLAVDPITLLGFTIDHKLVVEFTKGEGETKERKLIEVDASKCYIKGINPEDRKGGKIISV